jgi:CRP-like cAMP-binding protein
MGILLEMHYNSFTAGQIIFEEDDKAKELYFIFRGEIELSRRLPEYITRDKKIELTQNNVVLAAYGKGQLFGDLEIMMKTNRITKARVLSPKVELYRIAKNKFFDNLGSFKVFDEMKKNAEMIS